MIIQTKSFPRAALIGNPSDGYFGKTIAFVFSNFSADITLFQTPELEIQPEQLDLTSFNSIEELVQDVKLHGYYGGMRLLKATVKVFYDHCKACNITLDRRNFTIRYKSTIPHRLGLAGSSAIITAGMKALISFYGIPIPKPILANLVLSVETDELKIGAGLQDRVAQAYETPVFMDFDRKFMDKQGFGMYAPIDTQKFPAMYIAYRIDQSSGSEVVHNDLRARYNYKEPEVLDAMKEWAELSEKVRDALESCEHYKLPELIDRNFDLRKSLIPISKENLEMVRLARSTGASAKFTGSGGAIIGTYEDEKMFTNLKSKLNKKGIEVIKPIIVNHK
ncbi:MAG: mevalonate kinase [Anaerolineales bacterium]